MTTTNMATFFFFFTVFRMYTKLFRTQKSIYFTIAITSSKKKTKNRKE